MCRQCATCSSTRGRNQGNLDAAISRERTARLRREYLEAAIPLEIEAAHRRWRAALNAVSALNQGVVQQSAKNLDVIRQAYQLGQLRLLDVLNEQRRMLDTELSYIDAKAELARAEVTVAPFSSVTDTGIRMSLTSALNNPDSLAGAAGFAR